MTAAGIFMSIRKTKRHEIKIEFPAFEISVSRKPHLARPFMRTPSTDYVVTVGITRVIIFSVSIQTQLW